MNKRRLFWFLTLLVCFGTVALLSKERLLRADAQEKTSVSFSEFTGKHTIEDSVLFVGTHLMHLQSMTDELYELALESASESNQTQVYYKSELAGGAWFDITDAAGLAEISEEGSIVSPEAMKNLQVEYYTFSDGITRNALTGEKVNLFEIKDPYDLYEMEELEALRQQFNQQFTAEDTGVKKYYYDKLREFFLLDLRNNVTAECDRQLKELQTAYENLQASGEKELAEIVVKLMNKIDAKRRAEILYQLSQAENHLLNKLQNICTGSEYEKEKYLIKIEVEEESSEESSEEATEEEKEYIYEKEQFVENSGVLDAISSALQSCQTAYIEKTANSLEPGTTILKNLEYEKSMYVINQGASGSEAVLRELNRLYHIQEDMVADETEELLLIETQALPRAEEKYVQALSQGVGEEYKVALANGGSQTAVNQALEQQKAALNTVLQELKFLVRAQTKRQSPQDALTNVYGRIDQTADWGGGIAGDAFSAKAKESLEEYRIWLQQLAKTIATENEELASEMDALEKNKEELLVEYQQALDDNDLALAKKYQAMLEALDEEIKLKQKELQSIIDDPNSSLADKAKAANQAGGSTLLNHVQKLKEEALSSLADGSEDIEDTVAALASLGAEEALKNIKEKAEESGKEELTENVEQAIESSRDSSLHGMLEEGGTQVERNRVEAAIEDFYGSSFAQLTGKQQAEIMAVLNWLKEDGYSSLSAMSEEYYQLAEGSAYFYRKLTGEEKEYVALFSIAEAGGYRYIYDNTGREVTLSKGGTVYKLRAGEKKIVMQPQGEKELSAAAGYLKDVYIPEEDALLWFSCEAEYLQGKNTAICLTQKMKAEAEQFYQLISEGGE